MIIMYQGTTKRHCISQFLSIISFSRNARYQTACCWNQECTKCLPIYTAMSVSYLVCYMLWVTPRAWITYSSAQSLHSIPQASIKYIPFHFTHYQLRSLVLGPNQSHFFQSPDIFDTWFFTPMICRNGLAPPAPTPLKIMVYQKMDISLTTKFTFSAKLTIYKKSLV